MANTRTSWSSVAGALRGRPLAGYGLAIGSAVGALGVRLSLGDAFPPGFPFLTFFPAIIITSFFAGRGPGILCALLSLVAVWYFLVTPVHSFALRGDTQLALLFFIAVAGVDIILIDAMQHTLDRLDVERRLTAQLYDQQRGLFAELQHRVANNMAIISGLLHFEKRRVLKDPSLAAAAFDDAVARIEIMSRIHRRLHDPAAANAALEAHLRHVCDELIELSGATGVQASVDIPALSVPLERLLPLSLLVAEVVTNSLKHGFAGRDTGTITISLERDAAGANVLVIKDDGIGLPPDHDPARSTGLGMRIIQGLVAQLDGTISMASEAGSVTRVRLAS